MGGRTNTVVGIDLGATRLKLGLFSGNNLTQSKVVLINIEEKSQAGIIEKIKNSVDDLLKEARVKFIHGIGIGAAGVIDQRKGIITESPNFPQWRNFPLGVELSKQLGVRVILDNDANVVALGEYFYGAAKGVENFITITLGSGIGGGIFLNGNIWRGVDGMGGEIGHITVSPDGYPCNCGNRGCLEQYASINGFKNYIREDNLFGELTEVYLKDPYLPEKLYDSALRGDERILSYFNKVGTYLGVGIASLLNIFNVKLILLCGGVAKSFPIFKEILIEEVKRRTFKAIFEGVEIKTGSLWEDAGIYGAAYLILNL